MHEVITERLENASCGGPLQHTHFLVDVLVLLVVRELSTSTMILLR
ncbi:MAG: hypothetical protein ACLP05_09400 [Candidatus Kryptoniota bacterium]